ncbi:stage II sporulation protein P [Dendrosporobacter sp. 1207_IL3150]|uniref:stage II sporulation protein P n=1 Tax=Dendrosporobacter sp. 1207_IL3150 TaxID=3084054 RepID=UPI002FD8E56F
MINRRFLLIAGAVILIGVMTFSSLHLLPLQNFLSIQQKPEQAPQKVYDYYIIIDEQSGAELMYVPLVVSIGDEVLSEDNKLYEVVRVEENQAYARFKKDIKLDN